MKTAPPLQRGQACLCCRKKKMKCDGLRPVCSQCLKSNRASECQYYEKKHISRTQLLQQKVAKLEARLRELESEAESSLSGSSSSESSSSPAAAPNTADLLPGFTSDALSGTEWEVSLPEPQHSSLSSVASSSSSAHSSTDIFSGLGDLSWPSDDSHLSLPLDDTLTSFILQARSTSGTQNWWEDESSFCENKQTLLQLFLSHRHQCAFDVHLGRLQASLNSSSLHSPHPALMDAIFLLACFFSRLPHLVELEPHFLKRALHGISEALHQQDRILHVLQASCLIAVYFYCHGRVLEGYYHSSTSARLAIDLGLHQIRPIDLQMMAQSVSGTFQDSATSSEIFLPSPSSEDQIDHAERVATFWQIFVVDRAWSVATGLPSAVPDGDHPNTQIETSWPIGVMDISAGLNTMPLQIYNTNILGNPLEASTITSRAKAVMLFERTARFSSSSSNGDANWLELRSLEMSLAQFAANLPGIDLQTNLFASSRTDIDLINIHTLIYAATIHLNRDHIETQPASFEKCLVSANSVSAIVRQLNEGDYGFLDPITSTCWRCVADVYLRILNAGPIFALQCDLSIVSDELSMLIAAMRRLAFYLPVAEGHASNTEQQLLSVGLLTS